MRNTTAKTGSTSPPRYCRRQDPKRREIILADFDKQFLEWNEKVAGLVWLLRPPDDAGDGEARGGKLPAQQKQIVDILGA